MEQNRLKYLFEKYLDKKYSLQEKEELFQTISDAKNDANVQHLIKESWDKEFLLHDQDPKKSDIIFQNIIAHQTNTRGKVRKLYFRRYAAAAVVIGLILSVAGYFYFNKDAEKQIAQTETQHPLKNDIPPGGNKAVLTLADGTQIVLDSANNGTITQQGNTKIIKLSNGELAYNTLNEKPGEVLYNTISTPKGGQYQIVLSDGSKVWLNAASSLRFPTSFPGTQRNVELTGEGYFEIAKNVQKPFHVRVNDMEIEVLGTHFNVNAYSDETAIKTTLLKGSVKVTGDNNSVLIKPGQQAELNAGQLKVKNGVNIKAAIGWKDELFIFESDDIETIMRQLGRWYNVEVNFRYKTNKHFTGVISRKVNVSEVLKMLEMTGEMHFKIDGRKVIIEK